MEMAKDVRLRLDRVSYTLAINAYEKANQWQEAVHLLRSFQKAADIMFYNAAINACADQWQQGVLVLSQLNEDQIRANAVTYGALLSACRNGRAWIPALRLLSELFQLKLETNSVVFNATINACGRAEQWTHALEVMSIMEQEQIQPDLITYDTIIAATASCACREEALLLLSQSQSLRTPLEALWVLATVGSNDVEVICASFRETLTLDLEVANVVQLLWCMARLGINQQRLERSLCQRFLENLQSCSLEQLLLVAVAVERRPDITTFDRLQQAAEERSEALQPKDMAFQLKGISLLGFVSSCQRAGLLRQHLKVSIHRSLLDFGRTMDSIDAEGPSLPVQDVEVLEKTKNLPCFAGDYGDRVVLFKPGGWEVYGAHHPRQLSEFLRSYGDRPILADENHNLDLQPNTIVFNSTLSACAKGEEWEVPLCLLEALRFESLQCSLVTYNAAISASAKGSQWQLALAFLSQVGGSRIEPDIITYNSTMAACDAAGRSYLAICLLQQIQARKVQATIITYNTAISACAKNGWWQEALELLWAINSQDLQGNVVTFTSAISACSQDGEWQQALTALQMMLQLRVQANVFAYNAAISACGAEWEMAVCLLVQSRRMRQFGDIVTFSALNS
eukprot:g12925.t1